MLSGAAYYGMVRQNASLENMVQVRAARLQERRTSPATPSTCTPISTSCWPGSAAASPRTGSTPWSPTSTRSMPPSGPARRAGEGRRAAERKPVDASLAALAAYRKAVQETIEMAQVDQSIATNSMQKAEKEFGTLNQQLAQLAALEKTLSEAGLCRRARRSSTPGHDHGRCWCCCRSRCRWR
jgi:hypothetical protein